MQLEASGFIALSSLSLRAFTSWLRCQAELPEIPTSWSLIFSHPRLLPHPHPLPYLNSSWLNSSLTLLNQNTCIKRLLQELNKIMRLWQPRRCATYMSLQERACCKLCSGLTTSSCCIFSIHCSVRAKATLPRQLPANESVAGILEPGHSCPMKTPLTSSFCPGALPRTGLDVFRTSLQAEAFQPILLPSLPSLPSKM